MSLSGTFYVRPAPGELVDAECAAGEESRSVLCGRVSGEDGGPLSDAAVALYADDLEAPVLLDSTVTDRHGQFLFGPLECGRLYMVKVFKPAPQTRHLPPAET